MKIDRGWLCGCGGFYALPAARLELTGRNRGVGDFWAGSSIVSDDFTGCWDIKRGGFAFNHACLTFLLECFAFEHACCLPHSAKQNGLREVTFLFRRGSGSPVVRSRVDVRLSDLAGSLRVCAFSGGDPDGVRKRRGNAGDEERSRRRGRVRFCVTALALLCFPRGVRWGLRAPKPAPKSLRLSGLSSFDSQCECVSRGEGRSGTTKA